MKLRRMTLIALVAAQSQLAACGYFDLDGDDEKPASATHHAPTPAAAPGYPKKFEGYVMSAFAITVDEQPYEDMEDFYTQELDRLPEKVAAAGYDSEWKVSFEAEVGLSDLWRNMEVFVAPNG